MVSFKIYDVKTGQQIINCVISQKVKTTIQCTMKFGQLIEFNMRNISLQKLYTKCGEEASPRPFYKKSKLRISLNQQSEML